MSDDFLKNLREGSETAFKELIKAHRQKVIGVCFGFLRNQEDSEGMDSSKEFDENQRSKVLLKALSKMPESQRIALTLSKLDGFSNPEISEIMQTSVSGVESLVHRGKESLKQILNKFYSEYLK